MRPFSLPRRLRRFATETDGYITVEAMIVLPALLMIFAAAWVYFDVFHQQSINQKANYAIGDMVSRETDPIDDTYVDNAFRLLGLLTRTDVNLDEAPEAYPADLRITVVSHDADNDSYEVMWSAARGDFPELTTADLTGYRTRLPEMQDNGQTVLVETSDAYKPLFRVGLDAFEIKTYSFTHPRYAPQVLWAD
ncbi:TadE/TadG family type IV pilus assembly protein [Salipiger mucosus]|uniref:ABC-type dipeptide transport system, periplasmic component n=1 Tax=Salipiger mucosus DSM 16094 TaxID=1123237 RepID=S9R0X3_9RHOB|nr:pilus assembly protein [Salipiger mucosus]EPX85568.1 hypothetical protein Salmuc_04839 [Salipiger mucosus DSM 16094]